MSTNVTIATDSIASGVSRTNSTFSTFPYLRHSCEHERIRDMIERSSRILDCFLTDIILCRIWMYAFDPNTTRVISRWFHLVFRIKSVKNNSIYCVVIN